MCIDRLQVKFRQNRDLYVMLKTTEPKILAEASTDKTWGTGVPIRDSQALNTDKWHGKGWLSNMLTIIRDEYQSYKDK